MKHSRHARTRAKQHPRRRALRRTVCFTLAACLLAGGAAYWFSRPEQAPTAALPQPSVSTPASGAASSAPASSALPEAPAASSEAAASAADPVLGVTTAQAQAMLDDPLMVLVNHHSKMPDDYTFETAECGSDTAINKSLQTVACQAFLEMQAAAASDGVTIRMQSGYRSVAYQTTLYERKTQYYREQGLDEAAAREKAATIVNPPGYSEHNCGLAADLNTPGHPTLDEGFEDTDAFRWLCEHAVEYGFILRYPKGAEATTEITYEPWHWRYVGPENAVRILASGLCLEDYIAGLHTLAAQQ